MRFLAQLFPEFAAKLDEMDALYAEKRFIDEKTYQFICFALSIKARSKPWSASNPALARPHVASVAV